MKNQFYDTVNCSTLEIVCFKQIKSCILTEKPYAIYSILYMLLVVLALPHEVKARWGYFTFSRTQLPVLMSVRREGKTGSCPPLEIGTKKQKF